MFLKKKGKKMNTNDFGNIMNNGFKVDYKGEDSELRCFECGEYSEMDKVKGKWKMVCKNNHKYELIDFLVLHIDMRDGAVREFFNGGCSFEDKQV